MGWRYPREGVVGFLPALRHGDFGVSRQRTVYGRIQRPKRRDVFHRHASDADVGSLNRASEKDFKPAPLEEEDRFTVSYSLSLIGRSEQGSLIAFHPGRCRDPQFRGLGYTTASTVHSLVWVNIL